MFTFGEWILLLQYLFFAFLGALLMLIYLTLKLHRFGWSWRRLTGKIAEDKLHKKFMEEQSKPYEPNEKPKQR